MVHMVLTNMIGTIMVLELVCWKLFLNDSKHVWILSPILASYSICLCLDRYYCPDQYKMWLQMSQQLSLQLRLWGLSDVEKSGVADTADSSNPAPTTNVFRSSCLSFIQLGRVGSMDELGVPTPEACSAVLTKAYLTCKALYWTPPVIHNHLSTTLEPTHTHYSNP